MPVMCEVHADNYQAYGARRSSGSVLFAARVAFPVKRWAKVH
ncbi:MAG TPA: hypothetical protein VGR11_03760 [Solirubrobacteraceae bacterium]|nr:hypothetical protein [Solirubrobacteraceae bacterium]